MLLSVHSSMIDYAVSAVCDCHSVWCHRLQHYTVQCAEEGGTCWFMGVGRPFLLLGTAHTVCRAGPASYYNYKMGTFHPIILLGKHYF